MLTYSRVVSDLLAMPVPYPYYHLMNVILCCTFGILVFVFSFFKSYLTSIPFLIMLVIYIGLREVSVGLADPFGEDFVDFPLAAFLLLLFCVPLCCHRWTGGNTRAFLRLCTTHSNPNIILRYLPVDARERIRIQIAEDRAALGRQVRVTERRMGGIMLLLFTHRKHALPRARPISLNLAQPRPTSARPRPTSPSLTRSRPTSRSLAKSRAISPDLPPQARLQDLLRRDLLHADRRAGRRHQQGRRRPRAQPALAAAVHRQRAPRRSSGEAAAAQPPRAGGPRPLLGAGVRA